MPVVHGVRDTWAMVHPPALRKLGEGPTPMPPRARTRRRTQPPMQVDDVNGRDAVINATGYAAFLVKHDTPIRVRLESQGEGAYALVVQPPYSE